MKDHVLLWIPPMKACQTVNVSFGINVIVSHWLTAIVGNEAPTGSFTLELKAIVRTLPD